jgi:hypothetical protein
MQSRGVLIRSAWRMAEWAMLRGILLEGRRAAAPPRLLPVSDGQ